MAFYIKCNEKTYQAIGAPAERVKLSDGNHIAWQADFTRFEEWPDIRAIATRTGSLLLQPSEAREEQDGVCCRELPEATDCRFRMESEESKESESSEKSEPSESAPDSSDNSDSPENSDSSETTEQEGGAS